MVYRCVQAQKDGMGHYDITEAAKLGAFNLLAGCAQAQAGERLLIVREPAGLGYYAPGLAGLVADVGRDMGLRVSMVDAPFMPEAPTLPDDLRARMEQADVTLFLARLGDQLRFASMPKGRAIVCFAVTEGLMASAYGTADHGVFVALKNVVNQALCSARHVRVTCPAGTDFSGAPDMGDVEDTSVLRFPVSVFAPVPGGAFSGRVALPGFLAGTGSRYYSDYMVRFDGPVLALFSAGQLTGFEGSAPDVARANTHYSQIAGRYDIERNRVHSWHAGIHPGCGYGWDAFETMERWSGVAFGNPRILHLHTCGADAPGEISWNVIDPTIEIDGIKMWENGVFYPGRVAGGAQILRAAPMVKALFDSPDRRIGLDPIASFQTA